MKMLQDKDHQIMINKYLLNTLIIYLFYLHCGYIFLTKNMKKVKLYLIILLAATHLYSFSQPSRKNIEINEGWSFRSKDISGDSISMSVNIPHTWNSYDASNGFDYYRGKALYQKTVTVNRDFEGNRLFLRFNGVQSVADVYWNDFHLGQHRGGYSAFIFEVTPLVRFDSANVIKVVADNSRFEDVLPLSGDFNIYGGIYRTVQLFSTGKVCISPMDYASSGLYLKQRSVNEDEAKIDEELILSNASKNEKSLTIITYIFDSKGLKILSFQKDEKLLPGETKTVRQPFSIAKPHLWDGRSDPYLYNCRVQVLVDGVVSDEISQPLGMRFFRVDADKGFFLNGKALPLHGVSRHQDIAGKASALSSSDHKTDMDLICEMGANAISLSHYQHDEYFYSLCDSVGMVVWSEIPFVGSLSLGFTNSESFRDNARQQLTELIRQNYNHPSICFWGIFNELSHPKKDSPVETVKILNELASKEDSTRLTTAASFSKDRDSLNFITSLIAWNKYFGWYYGKPEMVGPWADKVHREFPALKIGISEYGAGGSVLQHSEKIRRPFPISHYLHPEEYQALCHEKYWAEIVKRPYIWGSFIWNMFDFSVAYRNEGDTPARNNKGMVTYDRKVKKDAFYFYKANWNTAPMVYICNRRFIRRTSRVTHAKVYSNAESVELFVNSTSLGIKTGKNAVFEWKNVILQKGNNSIKAVAVTGNSKIEDTCLWYCNNNPAINALIWFLRIGIKPFIILCIITMAYFYIKTIRLLRKDWKRRLSIISFWLITLLLVIMIVVFVFGKMNNINIFDYSVI
jgi:beta-galactosidase